MAEFRAGRQQRLHDLAALDEGRLGLLGASQLLPPAAYPTAGVVNESPAEPFVPAAVSLGR